MWTKEQKLNCRICSYVNFKILLIYFNFDSQIEYLGNTRLFKDSQILNKNDGEFQKPEMCP